MDVQNAFHAELIADLYAAATGLGYDLVLSALTPARDERRAAETLLDFRCEALILLGPDESADRFNALGRELSRRGDRPPDPVRSRRRGTRGRRPGCLPGSRPPRGPGPSRGGLRRRGKGTIAADRRRGYRQDVRAQGLADRLRIIPGDHTEEAGKRRCVMALYWENVDAAWNRAVAAGAEVIL